MKIVEEIRHCTKCRLHQFRKNPVPGEGSLDARIMFVGEAPGRKEDEPGRPFVGSAGALLNSLLRKIGLRREEVYITNIVKCRPPGNRDPKPDEIEACLPYLIRQIRLIEPEIIVALGRHAGRTLYRLAGRKWINIRRHRGRVIEASIADVRAKLFVTYHPAAALYNPALRGEIEEDFEKIKELIGGGRRRGLLDYFQ